MDNDTEQQKRASAAMMDRWVDQAPREEDDPRGLREWAVRLLRFALGAIAALAAVFILALLSPLLIWVWKFFD
jgi:Flp pilus assembly protein TadB